MKWNHFDNNSDQKKKKKEKNIYIFSYIHIHNVYRAKDRLKNLRSDAHYSIIKANDTCIQEDISYYRMYHKILIIITEQEFGKIRYFFYNKNARKIVYRKLFYYFYVVICKKKHLIYVGLYNKALAR